MDALPPGTVTFFLTDVEGSTRRWEEHPDAMGAAMAMHDQLIGECLRTHRGHVVESGREGDSVLAVFSRAGDAVACALELQRRLAGMTWPEGADIRIRIALNTGAAELRGGHYYGQAVYRCARILATAHGGQVLVSQATSELVGDTLPQGAGLADLGFHHLKDLDRPERIFQLEHPELESNFPALRSQDAYRHNLPAAPSSFIDRPRELAQIKEALASSRMLTLTGPAGCGKTRLALQTAAGLVERHADGVWVAELGALQNPALVATTLLHRLGVPEEPGSAPSETLTAYLRTRQLVLILDDCEHLADAVAELAGRLLAAAAGLQLLATSRQALHVTGEARLRVPPMALAEAVALFSDRARAARPGLTLAGQEEVVAEICRRLDGIPLAVELAAARTNVMSAPEILQRLEDRFALLTTGPRTAAARHRTLQAAIDWSHELLGEPSRILFRRLAVFAGGFRLEAAEKVCGFGSLRESSVLDELGELVDQSLVQVYDTAAGTRYAMLDTVRAYGQGQLVAAGESEELAGRHAGYFLRVAEAEGPESAGWLQRLDVEEANLRAVFEGRPEAEVELRLAASLRGYWDARGHSAEGRARLTAALEREHPDPALRATALRGLAFMAWAQGDYAASTRACEEAMGLYRSLGDRAGEGMCLQQLGQISFQAGDFGRAREHLDAALALAEDIGDQRLVALCQFRSGVLALFAGGRAQARRLLEASLDSGRRQGNEPLVVAALLVLGHLELRQRRHARARARFSESLRAARRHSGPRQVATMLDGFAALAVAEGQAERALRLAAAADRLREEAAISPNSPFQRDVLERLRPARELLNAQGLRAADEAPLARDEAIAYALGEVTD